MLEKKDLIDVREKVQVFFQKMCFSVHVETEFNQSTLSIILSSDEPRLLIGERGRVLGDIQRLFRIILQKGFAEEFYVHVDVNGYKRKKAQYLKELATDVANQVALEKKEKQMEPMSSFERRIVHIELAGRSDVSTESIGNGLDRRVVIKPFLT